MRKKKREKTRKEYATYPTVVLKIFIFTLSIESHEELHVDTIDIIGVYLHSNNNEYVIMLSRGRFLELMATVNPKI